MPHILLAKQHVPKGSAMPTQGLKAVQIGFNNSAQSRNQICSIQPEMSGYRTVIVDSWSNLQLKLPNTKKKKLQLLVHAPLVHGLERAIGNGEMISTA